MTFEISPKESEKFLNWYDANLYCQLLDIDGKSDWRLPSETELKYIYHTNHDLSGTYYWSSKDDGDYAYVVEINIVYSRYFEKNITYFTRAVRSI